MQLTFISKVTRLALSHLSNPQPVEAGIGLERPVVCSYLIEELGLFGSF